MRAGLIVTVTLVLALCVTASGHWDESMPAKWVQLPDLAPTGMDVNCTEGNPDPKYILADDFLCIEPGYINDIHIWGSWYHDVYPEGNPANVYFRLSIHDDIPDSLSPTGYSMPGALLWQVDVDPGQFTVQNWAENLEEGWFDPPLSYDPFGDTVCWQYNFHFIGDLAFYQEGTEENPKVYWLDVQAYSFDQAVWFGWKTSREHWNDDGVYGYGAEPYAGPWYELRYPPGHQMEGDSIDLAFVIGGGAEEPTDWGDAPQDATGSYPTTLAFNGARHAILPGLQLGQLIDAEPDGQPDPAAMGDDMNNLPDEDGVIFTSPITPGGTATVDVDLTFSTGGVLDAWLDFDGDGGWAEPGDYIFASYPLTAGGINNLSFAVPASAQPGQTFARFRLTQNGISTYTGAAPDGEVEDYEVFIEGEEWKWFQRPDLDDTGTDVNGTEPYILADDYECTAPGRLTEIYVWGSWQGDYLPFEIDPTAVDFTLSIHEDIPADTLTGEYSRPGDVLWHRTFPLDEFTAEIWQDGIIEGCLNPPDFYVFPCDTTCWLYTFYVPPEEAFHQVGMPDSAVVYWLDVQARPHDVDAVWGWKTSPEHWNDDAVWGTGVEPYFGPWNELRYPANHAWVGQSIDLAFGLRMTYGTGVPDEITPESYRLRQNTPNPFNPRTSIRYEVPAKGGHVEIEIVDVAGRLVRTLVNEHQTAGEKTVEWDGRDEAGNQMATGVYFYRLKAAGVEESRKMLLLK